MLPRRNKRQKGDAAVGLDLGSSQIKAAVVQKRAGQLALVAYAICPVAAAGGKRASDAQLTEKLQQVMNELGVQDRKASVTISCNSAMVCKAEVPIMSIADVKSALRLGSNSARLVRRDLSNFCFDVVKLREIPADRSGGKTSKMEILVGGADKEEIAAFRRVLDTARIRPEIIELAAISVINGFQASHPDICEKELVLLIDVGAKSTSINFLRQGEPLITRIMHFGGVQLSEYVAQMLSMEPLVAEEEKVKMSEPVQALIETALSPLAREIRSSIDFFERQHECGVTKALACGGTACSQKILDMLSKSVGMHFQVWNPLERFDTAACNGEAAKLGGLAPTLAAAIGAATARLS